MPSTVALAQALPGAGTAASREPVVAQGLTLADWILAGAAVLAGIVLGRVARVVIRRWLRRGDSEREATEVVGRTLAVVLVLAGITAAMLILRLRIGPFLGALGIGGIAIAFATQSILANALASVLLRVRRPFRRGDQIAVVDGIEGTVLDVNFRTVVLRTFAGERVLVPCGSVLDAPITNHTALGRRRTSLALSVDYDTDLELMRTLVLDAVAGVDGVAPRPAPEVWVEAFGESGIDVAVRYWHAPDVATLWRVRNGVAIAAKRALDGAGISIPFPQMVVRDGRLRLAQPGRDEGGEGGGGGGGGG